MSETYTRPDPVVPRAGPDPRHAGQDPAGARQGPRHPGTDPLGPRHFESNVDDRPDWGSAVSWGAIFAGAAGAAALSLFLMVLGTGLGLSAVSPWRMEGISASTFGVAAVVWLIFSQIAAYGLGGFLAGRLRKKWTYLHSDEMTFRDTAHGLLTWAISSLVMAAMVASAGAAIIGGGISAATAVAGGAASAVGTAAQNGAGQAARLTDGMDTGDIRGTVDYFVDSLFRNEGAPTEGGASDANQGSGAHAVEVARIVSRALQSGNLPQEDERYVGRLIAQNTDLDQQQAQRRVSDGFAQVQTTLKDGETMARQAADDARRASANAALWTAAALLLGAFVASLMAYIGGRQREEA